MKRNYFNRTNKFVLFLFGMGAGLLSIVPATYAQNQLSPLAESVPAIRSPRELMRSTDWNEPSTVGADDLAIRSPIVLNRVIVDPELAKSAKVKQNIADSIRVDSTVFNLEPKNQADAIQIDTSLTNQRELKLLQPLKIPVKWNRLQPIKQPKQVSVVKPERPKPEAPKIERPRPEPPIVASASVATTGRTEAGRVPIVAKQIAATSEGPELAVPKASLAFLRKPMDLKVQTELVKITPVSKLNPTPAKALLQPISAASVAESTKEKVTKPAPLAKAPTYDFQTPLPTGPISLFVDGPDYLSVNQIGEYEIAVANTSSQTTSVPSISLQVPHGAEIIAVQREAQIDDQKRTLNWSIDQIGSGKQQRIRFRVKIANASKVDFPVTITQKGRESQTVSQTTFVR